MTTVVLVHGAFHDAWCWELVRRGLDERGVPNQAIDLPFTGLDGDAEAVGKLLDAIDGPAVVCGHSYGGMVISRAASGRTCCAASAWSRPFRRRTCGSPTAVRSLTLPPTITWA